MILIFAFDIIIDLILYPLDYWLTWFFINVLAIDVHLNQVVYSIEKLFLKIYFADVDNDKTSFYYKTHQP